MVDDKQFRKWIHKHKRTPFKYGEWDCALACCQFIKDMTGKDHLPNIPPYKGEDKAYAVLDNSYGSSLINALSNHLENPIHPSKAIRGDVGVLIIEGREICGIRDHHHWWVACTKGMRPIPVSMYTALKAWRIE